MLLRQRSLMAMLAAVLIAMVQPHGAAAQFYRDKTVNVLVNSGAGGNSDLIGRLFMRYIGKYLAGKPVMVPRNMVGAGGLLGTNYLAEVVKPDGLTFGIFLINGGFAQLIGAPELHTSFSDFEFIAGIGAPIVSFIRKDVAPGMNKPEDIVKAPIFYGGGYNRESTHDVMIRLTLDVIGAKYKMVTGYPDATKMFLAVLGNEIQYSATSLGGFRTQFIPNLRDPGLAIVTWQYPHITPDGRFERYKSVGDIPTFVEVYEGIYGKPPSGLVWDSFVQVVRSGAITRAIIAPKGTPKEAVAELRQAMARTVADVDFQNDYQKMMGEPPSLVSVEDGHAILRQLANAAPEVRTFLRDYVK